MRLSRTAVFAWLIHLVLSMLLVVTGLGPGLADIMAPGEVATGGVILIFAARVLSSPLVPLAEMAGIPVWNGHLLELILAANSALWVIVLGMAWRRLRRLRTPTAP
jgi:hypothetical protein